MKQSVVDRFMKYVCKHPSGCWLWTGNKNNGGYGKFQMHPKTCIAHRVAFELFKGLIPPRLQLDHLCRNRSCVNPEHLEPVSAKENMRRGINFTKQFCTRGHERTSENTYHYPDGRRRCKSCRRADDNMDLPKMRRKLHKRKMRAEHREEEAA